jgi:hypothetical protein
LIFEYDGRLHSIIAQDASVSGSTHVPVAAALQNGDGEAQRDINAALIAAAPDLLEAAEQAEKELRAVSANYEERGFPWNSAQEARDKLRAAIARAKREGS